MQVDGVCISYPHPLGGFRKLDCSTTKRVPVPIPNDTSSESSRRDVSNAVLFSAPTLLQLSRYRPWNIGAGGCDSVTYTVLYGTRYSTRLNPTTTRHFTIVDQGIDPLYKPAPARSACVQLQLAAQCIRSFPVQSMARGCDPHVSHETDLESGKSHHVTSP